MKNLIIIASLLAVATFNLNAQDKEAINTIAVTIVNEDNSRVIEWATEMEVNTSYFLVESSEDNQHFKPVARVKAAGYSLTGKHYAFEATGKILLANYCRVVMVSMTGERSNSLVVNNNGISEGVFVAGK